MSAEKVRRKGGVVRVTAGNGYSPGVSLLCKLQDTGNGYIAKFPSYSSVEQDNYLCMDYAEASYLYAALGAMLEQKEAKE